MQSEVSLLSGGQVLKRFSFSEIVLRRISNWRNLFTNIQQCFKREIRVIKMLSFSYCAIQWFLFFKLLIELVLKCKARCFQEFCHKCLLFSYLLSFCWASCLLLVFVKGMDTILEPIGILIVKKNIRTFQQNRFRIGVYSKMKIYAPHRHFFSLCIEFHGKGGEWLLVSPLQVYPFPQLGFSDFQSFYIHIHCISLT